MASSTTSEITASSVAAAYAPVIDADPSCESALVDEQWAA